MTERTAADIAIEAQAPRQLADQGQAKCIIRIVQRLGRLEPLRLDAANLAMEGTWTETMMASAANDHHSPAGNLGHGSMG